jgi:catechol 2,3-dioxygenase-like lactoylglutathione lyase family enzyme
MAMLDHISLGVRDLTVSGAFYDAALAPLGYRRVLEKGIGLAYGPGPDRTGTMFWIVCPKADASASRGTHVAFAASDRAAVDGFHAAALSAGARDNGAPGLRPEYSENYYGAFVLDPDGHKVEAVCRTEH